jgi:co-chaperonin GroES (HSP10)
MNVIGDKYHIEIDEEANWKLEMGDMEIFFDPEFRLHENTIQFGHVLATPSKYRESVQQFGNLAEVGAKVYFHHHVHDKDNKVNASDVSDNKDFYIAEPLSLYCQVIDGEIQMLNDFVLVEPIEEDESNYKTASGIMTKARPDMIPNYGIVRHVPSHASKVNLKPGDKIFFTENSNYELNVEGKDYYCMQMNRDIPYVVEEDGSARPIGMWGLVEALDEGDNYEENSLGLYVKRKHNVQQHKGKIYKLSNFMEWEVSEGEDVIFDRKGYLSTKVNEKTFYCVNILRDIILSYCV